MTNQTQLSRADYSVSAPVDPTQTRAWEALKEHYKTMSDPKCFTLKQAFKQDPKRVSDLSFEAAGLHIDLSKNLIDKTTLTLLADLAKELGLEARRDAMFHGAHINTTEDRAVLHTALRRPASEIGTVFDGKQDCVQDVHEVLNRMYAFAERVRSGEWTGISNKRIKTVVSIGIGGSDLGPVMVYEALKPYANAGISCRYVSNIDPVDMAEKLVGLDPETTLVIVVSKTFTTLETLTNARTAKAWLISSLQAKGLITDEADKADAIKKHFVAVSTALDRVEAFGIDPANAFGFWNWVGGRYSVDSAVGLSLIVALGPKVFTELLQGFYDLDRAFEREPLEQNVVALMGLLNIWYVNFFGYETHAVLPYSQYLHRFPAYLQQLTMESNGKHVRWDGTSVTTSTGEIFWGEPGTNGQHAFYQLIHQGTRVIPADFIAFVNTAHPTKDVDGQDIHELFLGNYLAQTKALAFGKTAEQVRAEGTPEPIVPARVFEGNRPTTSIFADALTPHTLGALIALYEHITFVEGTVWGIDSYDQWGVELGKQLAKEITPAFHDDAALAEQDASTQAFITYYRAARK